MKSEYLTRKMASKAFVRAVRPTPLCSGSNRNMRVRVSKQLVVPHLRRSTGQKGWPKKCNRYRGMILMFTADAVKDHFAYEYSTILLLYTIA